MSRMRALAVQAVVIAVSAATVAGCRWSTAAEGAEQVARQLGTSEREVTDVARALARRHASSTDDVVDPWVNSAPYLSQARRAYEGVPPEARSIACDAVTQVLSERYDNQPYVSADMLSAASQQVFTRNQGAGSAKLSSDLESAAVELRARRTASMLLLVLSTGTCKVIG